MQNHAQIYDTSTIFLTMFNGLDVNGDGVVSMDEWELHYECIGIDLKHAKPPLKRWTQTETVWSPVKSS